MKKVSIDDQIAALQAQKAEQAREAQEKEFIAAMTAQPQDVVDARARESVGVHDADMIKRKLSWARIQDYRVRFRRRFYKYSLIVCNFELLTGHHTTCILPIVDGKIIFRKKTFIVDDKLKYWHVGYKEYCLDYHEGFSLPIQRKIPVNDISAAVKETNMGNISWATNPSTLQAWTVGDVIKSAIQAAGITDFLKTMRLLLIATLLGVLIHLVMYLNDSGFFQRVMNRGG